MSLNGLYSPSTTVKKGVLSGLLAFLPVVASAVSVGFSAPAVLTAIGTMWPGVPVAAGVGFFVAFSNWLKNRSK